MLAASKDTLVAGLKQNALMLRHKELEYYVERYSNITTQASILAGFAFDSLVELEIPSNVYESRAAVVTIYYIAASCTMALSLYTVCVSSFATVYGHRLALQGPTGSVDRAVAVMMKQRTGIFVTFGVAMVFLVIAAIAMAWIKMDFAHCNEDGTGCKVGNGVTPSIVTGIFVLFFVALVWKHQNMKALFKIGAANMVQGDVRLMASTTEVDIANIEAGFGAVDPVSIAEAEAAAARQFQSGGKAPMYRPPPGHLERFTTAEGYTTVSEISSAPLLTQQQQQPWQHQQPSRVTE
uniref:Transmembrane protein n=1 Tax=Phaeocystis antarctica TaxID=33657 RepID=A0A7S0HG64_9EUKA|mmetsp:Transcript_20297/g.48086  ORF Transcript_20297/g.48086 Transcript_20297/m.48086 type:complete len:294 (+) Transcript_20297:82-963(+)